MAELHDLLAMDSYWETLGLNGLRKRLIDYTYLVLILESSRLGVGYIQLPLLTDPLSWQGPMHFYYRNSNFTIAIITISILSLSTNSFIYVELGISVAVARCKRNIVSGQVVTTTKPSMRQCGLNAFYKKRSTSERRKYEKKAFLVTQLSHILRLPYDSCKSLRAEECSHVARVMANAYKYISA